MSKNLRSLATRLNQSLNRFSGAPLRQVKMPISVSLDLERKIGLPHPGTGALTVAGQTQTMSKTGIEFIVPFIRLGDYHLAGHGGDQQSLKLILELPNGTVRMTVSAQHYQMIEMHSSVQNYLISTEIVKINDGDAERYAHFLRHGEQAAEIKNTPAVAAAVELVSHKEKRSLFSYLSIF